MEKVRDEVWGEVDKAKKRRKKRVRSANQAGDIRKEMERMKDELASRESRYDNTQSRLEALEEELKGFEEKTGKRRALGAQHGHDPNRKTWLERRQQEEARPRGWFGG